MKVDTSLLVLDRDYKTTLAFVSLKANGERDFVFNRGADAYLTEKDINKNKILEHNIIHFGSATALLEDPFRTTYLNLMLEARKEGKWISFDPNYRNDLWKGRKEHFINLSKKGFSIADFVKVSDEELKIISQTDDLREGIKVLHQFGVKTIAVTLGKEGTMLSNGVNMEIVPSVNVNSIDSTGAGDAFVGATLFQLAKEKDPRKVFEDFEQLKKIIFFSNKVGALVCTKIGAISAIPSIEEVSYF